MAELNGRLHLRVGSGVERNRKAHALAAIRERRSLPKRQHFPDPVNLHHELADEIHSKDAVEPMTGVACQFLHRKGDEERLTEALQANHLKPFVVYEASRRGLFAASPDGNLALEAQSERFGPTQVDHGPFVARVKNKRQRLGAFDPDLEKDLVSDQFERDDGALLSHAIEGGGRGGACREVKAAGRQSDQEGGQARARADREGRGHENGDEQ